jgi:hypothetical protein
VHNRIVGSLPGVRRAFALLAIGAVLSLAAPSTFAGGNQTPGLPDLDARDAFKPDARPDEQQAALIEQLRRSGVRVTWDDRFGTPRMIVRDGGFLTEPSDASPQDIALAFLAQWGTLFGLDMGGPGVASTQPGRPFVLGRVWNTRHNNTTHVLLEQRIGGIRVFGSALNFTLDGQGRLAALGAQYDRNGAPLELPALRAEDAVLHSAELVGATPRDALEEVSDPSDPVRRYRNVFVPATMFRPHDVTAEPVVFPMPFGHGNRHAWHVAIEVGDGGFYEMVIDAVNGDLLYRRNKVKASGPEGNVYRVQNPTLGSQQITPFTGVNGGWVDADTTAGNNTIAFHDLAGDDTLGYQPVSAAQHFNYTYTDAINTSGGTDVLTDRDAVITQAFYYVNMLHERYYLLGFDEASGNFQADNFGRGGAEGDPVLVHVDWGFTAGICCNASMATPADGSSPRLRLRVGLAPDNLNMHRAMNGDTVTHEWVHGLSNRLVGGGNLGSGAQAGALGEGWSDAFATSLWNDPVYGEYNNGNMTTGIRGVAYDNNALTYGDLCAGGCQVHTDGRIWATAMWDMRTALRATYGAAAGTAQHEQLMVDGMKNTPTSPSFLDARDGILAADLLNNGGDNLCLLWATFAGRGMGLSATSSGSSSAVTPATDVPASCVPTADAGGPYTTHEGVDVVLDGTGSTPGDGTIDLYEWDFDNDGQFDDATGPNPAFNLVGQDGVYTVTLRVTSSIGLTDTASTTVTVHNVLPSIAVLGSNAPVPENSPVTVSGVISDPGWLDAVTGTIDWGDRSPPAAIAGVLENARPDATLSFSMAHTYGDNGTFTATVCGTDDHGTVCSGILLQVTNVAPTAEIDTSAAILINGVPAILATIGEPVDFDGRATDPGSDDLELHWDWDDGTTDTTMYLVNPPNPDPFPSPSIQPRDVTESISHTFADACFYTIGFRATDDDGGVSPTDTLAVAIVGSAERARSQGYWSQQLAPGGPNQFSEATLLCYLSLVGFMSQVFDEVRDASTIAAALEVLSTRQNAGDMRALLDVQLLAAWLNFANGAIGYDELVATQQGGPADTPFSVALAAAEAVRLDPAATRQALEEQKNILERINLRDGG